ncbi:universal stress protein [Pikeienuella sp. HZG-20]|uniref:universal stress protein n=1 Tax=Paludibacillus litoralis TaxID=3133267 RepID=UPI0030EE09BE
MPIKTILVSMNDPESAKQTLHTAVDVARRHGAHLIGLHVAGDIAVYTGYPGMAALPDLSVVFEEREKRAEEIAAVFRAATEGEDFVSEWRYDDNRFSSASDAVLEQCRAADLVIMGQERPDAQSGPRALILERTIRKSGRPVLVIPYAGVFEGLSSKALIGWSPTREAARAAHDALPLFAPGCEAVIVTARSKEAKSAATATAKELAQAYARHGVKAEFVERVAEDVAVGDILLNEAFERGVDLIVTGAFGHSRLYDFVIGAATTRLLESMTAPVLFSS